MHWSDFPRANSPEVIFYEQRCYGILGHLYNNSLLKNLTMLEKKQCEYGVLYYFIV
jgi:hypothetical protein